jgi:hypothetical protein
MTKTQATAEIFWTAFQVLPRQEQAAILERILKDKKLRQQLSDLERDREIARPVRTQKKRRMTTRQLASSELVGLWQDRTDIGDSVEFAHQLREKAQHRG